MKLSPDCLMFICDTKGQIIYFIEGRSLSRHKRRFCIKQGALMEHFLDGSALFKGFGKLTQKRRFVFVILLIWVIVQMS